MNAKNQSFFYWTAAVFFAITAFIYINDGFILKAFSSVCMVLAFVLLGLFERIRIPAMRWAIWLLIAIALSIQLLTLINKFGFNDQLF